MRQKTTALCGNRCSGNFHPSMSQDVCSHHGTILSALPLHKAPRQTMPLQNHYRLKSILTITRHDYHQFWSPGSCQFQIQDLSLPPQRRVQTFQQRDRSWHTHQLPQTKVVHVPIGIGTACCLLIPSQLSLSSTMLCVQHCMYYSVYLPLVSGLFSFLLLQYLTNVLTVIYMLILLYHSATLQGYWLLLNLHPQGMWLMDVHGALHQGQR